MRSSAMILLRTHVWDGKVRDLYQWLAQSGQELRVVFDEQQTQLRLPENVKATPIKKSDLSDLDLYTPNDYAWRCGDYSFYVTQDVFNFDFVWLIEYDVYLNFKSPGDFFEFFEDDSSDLLAPFLREASPSWSWHQRMARFNPNVWHCLFPIIRLSRHAIRHLLSERQKLSLNFFRENLDNFPNDESFVATTLQSGGYSCRDINDSKPEFYSPKTFSLMPRYYAAMAARMPDNMIYHSCVSLNPFLGKIRWGINHLSSEADKNLLRDFLREAIAAESNESSKVRLLEELQALQLR